MLDFRPKFEKLHTWKHYGEDTNHDICTACGRTFLIGEDEQPIDWVPCDVLEMRKYILDPIWKLEVDLWRASSARRGSPVRISGNKVWDTTDHTVGHAW